MTHDEIAAEYGIRPGDPCAGCGVPITADEIMDALGAAATFGGAAYHNDCAPQEAFEGVRTESVQISLDHARRTEGW